jgi:hypothetical protein
MPPDDFIPDFDRSDIFVIFDQNYICRANIRAGSASDAEALNWHDKVRTIPFFHFKRTSADNFFTYPNA